VSSRSHHRYVLELIPTSIDVEYGRGDTHFFPKERAFPIYSKCIKCVLWLFSFSAAYGLIHSVRKAAKINNLVPPILLPTVPALMGPDTVYRTITLPLPEGEFVLLWFTDVPGLYLGEKTEDISTTNGITNTLFVGSISVSGTNATLGTLDGRVLHFYQDEMDAYGVSRLNIASASEIPLNSVVV
jgi:hypothetical protein